MNGGYEDVREMGKKHQVELSGSNNEWEFPKYST